MIKEMRKYLILIVLILIAFMLVGELNVYASSVSWVDYSYNDTSLYDLTNT